MEVSPSESGATVQTLAVVWKTSHLSENLTFHCSFFNFYFVIIILLLSLFVRFSAGFQRFRLVRVVLNLGLNHITSLPE